MCGKSCLSDLVEALPARGCEGGGEVGDAECMCLKGGGCEADAETLEATGTSFGFVFKTLNLLKPCFVIVVTVNPRDAKAVCMALAFVFADVVFFLRIDVGIEIEDGGADAMLKHPLYDGGRAGGAAGVQQNLIETVGNFYVVLFLHVEAFRVAKIRFFVDNV